MTVASSDTASVDSLPTDPAEPRIRWWPRSHLVGLGTSLAVTLWLMWPTFTAKLGLIDDHDIVQIVGRHSRLPPLEIPRRILDWSDERNGRFRPGYWALRVLESAIAGHNASWWYVDRFLLAALCVVAIYAAAIRFAGPLGATVISLLPFAGPQWETFVRLGPNEAYAFPLALAGIAVIIRRLASGQPPARMWPAFLLLALAAFTKENFLLLLVLAVPATALAYGLRRLQRADWLVLAGATLLAAVDGVGILTIIHFYGPVYPQSHTWATFRAWTTWALATENASMYFSVGIIIAMVLLAGWSTTARRLRASLAMIVTIFLIAAPQLAFYAGNVAVGRYLIPFVLGGVAGWGICFWQARIMAPGRARNATTVVLLAVLAWPTHSWLKVDHTMAQATASSTQAFQHAMTVLKQTAVQRHDPVVVIQPDEPASDYEPAQSIARYLLNSTTLQVMFVPAAKVLPGIDVPLAAQIQQWSTRGNEGSTPYKLPARCLSVTFGGLPPVCPDSVPTP